MSSILPKVLVVGSGGVGAMTALGLTTAGKAAVTLVVRSDYAHVIKKGYTIDSVSYGHIDNWRPQTVVPSVQEAAKRGPYDFLVLTTKNIPDGPQTCEDIIAPAVTPGKTTIILVQNGIGIHHPTIKRFPENVVLSGVSLIGSSNINCHVNNLSKDQLLVGAFPNPGLLDGEKRVSEAIKTYLEVAQTKEGYNLVEYDPDPNRTRWEKLVFNSVYNTITTVVNQDITRCLIVDGNELVGPAMDEIYKIAASDGVEIDPSVKEKYIHIVDGLFYPPSMLIDCRKGQLFEMEVILGNPLKIAKQNGVYVPILTTIYWLLSMVQFRVKEQRGDIILKKEEFKGKDSYKAPELFRLHQEKKN